MMSATGANMNIKSRMGFSRADTLSPYASFPNESAGYVNIKKRKNRTEPDRETAQAFDSFCRR